MYRQSNFEIKHECGDGHGSHNPSVHTLTDKVTGVNYILITSDKGVAITPRLNTGGTLYRRFSNDSTN